MKLLGYKQIEVRPMAVKDAEHQLNLEISENILFPVYIPPYLIHIYLVHFVVVWTYLVVESQKHLKKY